MALVIVVVGAGSRQFGPATISDILLSKHLCEGGVEIVLVDKDAVGLQRSAVFAESAMAHLNRSARVRSTTVLSDALQGAHYVISAIETRRYFYWAQDFHIPRKHGFRQIYGENGGPGGQFHALRNMAPSLEIAWEMERVCPSAVLLNYTNPLTKLCELFLRCSNVRTVGLCHGVYQGMQQVAHFLEMEVGDISFAASGLNHFTWFETIRDRESGDDLYPALRERESKAHWLSQWDEIALSRILLRTYGLYPSPGANHIGEYLRFADEFLASDAMQFFYDRRDGDPWDTGRVPTWIYNLEANPTSTPLYPDAEINTVASGRRTSSQNPIASGELAIPIVESLSCGVRHQLDAVNVQNDDYVPGLPPDCVVEVPARSDASGVHPVAMQRLPEAILAHLRTQVSINKLLVEAFVTKSREPLLHALLLEPTVDSYQRAVDLVNEMFRLQGDVLPEMTW